MSPASRPVLLLALLSLAACGSVPQGAEADTSIRASSGALEALASAGTLVVGQTEQLTVTVGGRAPQPGRVTWTTSNAAVATVNADDPVTATGAGSATIRAALSARPSSLVDFTLTVTAPSTPAPTPGSGTAPSAYAQRVLELTNAARARARTCADPGGQSGTFAAAPALTWNDQLAQAAQGHATDMATKNSFSHTSQDGRTPADRVKATGYLAGFGSTFFSYITGENIAAGQRTPEEVVQGWLSGYGHRANIMNPRSGDLGVGYAQNSGSTYGSYWVQDFGGRS